LEGKISWECGITWRLTIQFKHDFLSYLIVQRINTYIAKQCSHVEFPYFVMGSHLGRRHMTQYFLWSLMGGTKIIIRRIMWPMSFVQVWTIEFLDCEIFISNFRDENYSNFRVLKLQNHFQEISLIEGFPKTSRACPNFPEILVFILLNFLWENCSIFNYFGTLGLKL